jgi:tetratricopeptide (TPR) repeat protein
MQMPERAADMFNGALRIEDNATGRSNLGTAYFFQGKYDLAIENYRAAAQKEPKNSVHWGNLGDALQAAGRKKGAVDAYRLAAVAAKADVKARPEAPHAHEQLALYCARSGDAACAFEQAAIADRLQPRNTEILFTNAVVRVIFGRVEEGFDWLERGVKIGLSKAEIQNEPAFAPFRESPRYRQILALAN